MTGMCVLILLTTPPCSAAEREISGPGGAALCVRLRCLEGGVQGGLRFFYQTFKLSLVAAPPSEEFLDQEGLDFVCGFDVSIHLIRA